jgi:hypothetical protein
MKTRIELDFQNVRIWCSKRRSKWNFCNKSAIKNVIPRRTGVCGDRERIKYEYAGLYTLKVQKTEEDCRASSRIASAREVSAVDRPLSTLPGLHSTKCVLQWGTNVHQSEGHSLSLTEISEQLPAALSSMMSLGQVRRFSISTRVFSRRLNAQKQEGKRHIFLSTRNASGKYTREA